MVDWRVAKAEAEAASETWFRETVMSTMEPEEISGGRRIEGNSIRRLSSVRSTATPASTLPTVSETSMMLNWKSSVVVVMPR